MYVQYKVNLSENQVDTLKDAIRLKKGVTLCFPKGGIRGDHVLLLTPSQFNRLDKAQSSGKRIHLRLSAKQVARNVSHTGGIIGMLASLAARAIPLVARAPPTILSESCRDLQLVYFRAVLTKRLVVKVLVMDFNNIPVLGWLL